MRPKPKEQQETRCIKPLSNTQQIFLDAFFNNQEFEETCGGAAVVYALRTVS